ncbi:alkaline phosphatase family protein [Candidatus Woesearchaeota archaeon]|nr:alkaline phosphatase family protein [Candidatus Woesearchaeota archaeon]
MIDPLLKNDRLPNIKKMIEHGVKAILHSTNPPVTCPAWPSFMTGKKPGNHGLFGFVDTAGGIASYEKIKGSSFWDKLQEKGIKSLVISVPVTYPPFIKKGIMISSILTPPNANYVYPPILKEEIEKNVPGYTVGFNANLVSNLKNAKNFEKFLKMIEKRYEMYKYLSKKDNFEVKVIVFSATDVICHMCWDDKEKIYEVYSKIDTILGDMLDKEKDANFLIVSDHGFGEAKRYIRINQYLEKKGFLNRKKGKVNHKYTLIRRKNKKRAIIQECLNKILSKTGITKEFIYRNINKNAIKTILRICPITPQQIGKFIPASNKVIDYKNTTAFSKSTQSQSITINATNPKEKEEIKKQLIKDLQQLKDPQTGKQVFRKILSKKEAYGKEDAALPDLYLDTNEYIVSSIFGEDVFTDTDFNFGKHYSEGIFIAYGKDINNNTDLKELNITDIAPTILNFFEIQPAKTDGKIVNIFSKNSVLIKKEKDSITKNVTKLIL